MLTATVSILDTDTGVQLALDHADALLVTALAGAQLLDDPDVRYNDAIDKLGDKPINKLASAIRAAITENVWHVADPIVAETFLTCYASKDKLADRRTYLRTWFNGECIATREIEAQLEHMRAEREAAKAATKSKRKSGTKITVVSPEDLEKLRLDAEAAGDTDTVNALAAAGSGAIVMVSGAGARAPKPPKIAGETKRPGRAPSTDRFATMSVEELQAAVREMFGVETGMKAVNHLRYRLRQGQRALDAGQKPQWSQAQSAIRLPVESATRALAFLTLHRSHIASEGSSHPPLDALIDEIGAAIAKLTADDSADEQQNAA